LHCEEHHPHHDDGNGFFKFFHLNPPFVFLFYVSSIT
jgi:hypothetical protein